MIKQVFPGGTWTPPYILPNELFFNCYVSFATIKQIYSINWDWIVITNMFEWWFLFIVAQLFYDHKVDGTTLKWFTALNPVD